VSGVRTPLSGRGPAAWRRRGNLTEVRTSGPADGAVQLFASAPSDPRARRPVDALRAVGYLLLVVAAALLSQLGLDLDQRLTEVLTSFPGFLRVLWLSGFWVAVGWSVALLLISAFRRRRSLAAEGVAAAVLAVLISVVVAAIVSGEPGDVVRRAFDSDGPPVFPPAAVAMTSAVIAVMAPFLTLPFRRFGRVLIGGQMLGSLFLGVAHALGAVTSLVIGLLAGTAMLLLRGSPGGFPTVTRVKGALADLGVGVDELAPTTMRREGVAVFAGSDRHGDLEVRVYGRDAWEG
jgi:hypothetical protein